MSHPCSIFKRNALPSIIIVFCRVLFRFVLFCSLLWRREQKLELWVFLVICEGSFLEVKMIHFCKDYDHKKGIRKKWKWEKKRKEKRRKEKCLSVGISVDIVVSDSSGVAFDIVFLTPVSQNTYMCTHHAGTKHTPPYSDFLKRTLIPFPFPLPSRHPLFAPYDTSNYGSEQKGIV